MKRITVILIMFLYLIPAIGVTVSAHFCVGKVTSVSFNPFDIKHDCPCGSKKMKNNCCKDVTTIFKLDDKQQKTQEFLFKIVKVAKIHPTFSTHLTKDYNTLFLYSNFDQTIHPPNDLKHPLYIRQCVFRI